MAELIGHYTPRGPRLRLDFSAKGKGAALSFALKSTVRRAIEEALFYERFFYDTEISVTVCDNETIRALNAEYRKKDSATDVLSFPMYEADELSSLDGEERVMLGDIVISLERAAEQAKELGHGTIREVAFLCIHSTLHLLGYDHEKSKEDEEDMCRRQREIMERAQIEETV